MPCKISALCLTRSLQAVIHGWGTASTWMTKFCADFGLLYFLSK